MEIDKIKQKLKSFDPKNPCLKVVVKALIISKDNQEIYGSNDISSSVDVCPREEEGCKTGEGYELCKNVCKQISHAEVSAINNAKNDGIDLTGASLYLSGHSYCCDNCILSMKRAGISYVYVLDSGKEYSFGKKD